MIGRFSNVVWWTAATIASFMALAALLTMFQGDQPTGITLMVGAILLGLFGRAVRYIISGI